MPKIDLSNVKPKSLGFYLCTVCERGDTPHTKHDGPYIRIDGEMLNEYWEERKAWTGVRSWYMAKMR